MKNNLPSVIYKNNITLFDCIALARYAYYRDFVIDKARYN